MVQSKEWNWNGVTDQIWHRPSEDCVFLAKHWKEEGAKTLLDLGCGLGRHAIYFAENGFEVSAVDLSAEAIQSVKDSLKQKNLSCNCMVADMMQLPFEDNSFDCVFSYHVISHQDTAGVQHVVDEISRVLKPGGNLFLTVCSKQHESYQNENYPHLDENTILKTEGAEVNVPHFFADKQTLRSLFHQYTFQQVRHITDTLVENDEAREKSHYYIRATLNP